MFAINTRQISKTKWEENKTGPSSNERIQFVENCSHFSFCAAKISHDGGILATHESLLFINWTN